MPTLRRSKLLSDALGQPLTDRLYTPISPHARGQRVFNPDTTQLPGSHEAVRSASWLWLPVDSSSPDKQRALLLHPAPR